MNRLLEANCTVRDQCWLLLPFGFLNCCKTAFMTPVLPPSFDVCNSVDIAWYFESGLVPQKRTKLWKRNQKMCCFCCQSVCLQRVSRSFKEDRNMGQKKGGTGVVPKALTSNSSGSVQKHHKELLRNYELFFGHHWIADTLTPNYLRGNPIFIPRACRGFYLFDFFLK